MASLIQKPTVIQAAGNKPKVIEEFIGRVNSQTADLSIARMQSPAGWIEPACCEPIEHAEVETPSRFALSTTLASFPATSPPRTSNGRSTSGGKGGASGNGSVSDTSKTNITGPLGWRITSGWAFARITRPYSLRQRCGGGGLNRPRSCQNGLESEAGC